MRIKIEWTNKRVSDFVQIYRNEKFFGEPKWAAVMISVMVVVFGCEYERSRS